MEKVMIFKNNLNYSLDSFQLTKAVDFESEDVKDLFIDFHLQGYKISNLGKALWKQDLEKRPTRSLIYSNANNTTFIIDILEYNEEILNSNFAVSKTESGKYKFWWITSINRVGQQKSTLYQVSLKLDVWWTYDIKTMFSNQQVMIKRAHIQEFDTYDNYIRILNIWNNPLINTNEGLEFNPSNYIIIDEEDLLTPIDLNDPYEELGSVTNRIMDHQQYNASATDYDTFSKQMTQVVVDVHYYWKNSVVHSTDVTENNLWFPYRNKCFNKESTSILRLGLLRYIDITKEGIEKELDWPLQVYSDGIIPYYYDDDSLQKPATLHGNYSSLAICIGNTPTFEKSAYADQGWIWKADNTTTFYESRPIKIEELAKDSQKVKASTTRFFINPLLTPTMIDVLTSATLPKDKTGLLYSIPKIVGLLKQQIGVSSDNKPIYGQTWLSFIPLWLLSKKQPVIFYPNTIDRWITPGLLNKVDHNPGQDVSCVELSNDIVMANNEREKSFFITNNVKSLRFFNQQEITVEPWYFSFTNLDIIPNKMLIHPFRKYSLFTPTNNTFDILRQFVNIGIDSNNYFYFEKVAVLDPTQNFHYIIPHNVVQNKDNILYGYDNRYNLYLSDNSSFIYPEDSNAYSNYMIANKSQLNQNYTNSILGGVSEGLSGGVTSAISKGFKNKIGAVVSGITGGISTLLDIYKTTAMYNAKIRDLKRTPGQWISRGTDLLGNNYLQKQFAAVFKLELSDPLKTIVKNLFIAHGYAIGGYYNINDFIFGKHQRYFFNFIQGLEINQIIKIPLNVNIKQQIDTVFAMGLEVRHIRAKMLKENGDWKSKYTTNEFNNYKLNNSDFVCVNKSND